MMAAPNIECRAAHVISALAVAQGWYYLQQILQTKMQQADHNLFFNNFD